MPTSCQRWGGVGDGRRTRLDQGGIEAVSGCSIIDYHMTAFIVVVMHLLLRDSVQVGGLKGGPVRHAPIAGIRQRTRLDCFCQSTLHAEG